MTSSEDHELYHRHIDAVLDSTISENELREFESVVLRHKELRRDFAARLAERSAMMMWDHTASRNPSVTTPATGGSKVSGRSILQLIAIMAVAVIALVSILWMKHDSSFAQIVDTQDCEWGETSFPTVANQRIAAGVFRLNKGLARLSFDHGATVNLEGPAVLQVVDRKTCRLLSGRAFSEIRPGGEGFVIETPTAVFTDRGTVFGLNVAENGLTVLSVLDGQVDVNHVVTGQKYSAFTNEVIRVHDDSLEKVEHSSLPSEPAETELVEKQMVQISTAVGRGADAFVQPEHNRPIDFAAPAGTLLLKRDPDHVWNRRIYLRFDLSLTDASKVEAAELQLYGVDTAMGYLSQLRETTVSVFGLTNEAEDYWSDETIRWQGSPASFNDHVDVDPSKTVLLGQFEISPSRTTGLFSISDSRLTDFLRSDTNGVMTLILTCDPVSKAKPGYVYGFASRRHPTEPAPSLRLTLPNRAVVKSEAE